MNRQLLVCSGKNNSCEKIAFAYNSRVWRGGRVVEGARLESVCAGNRTVSSNLIFSAKLYLTKRASVVEALCLPLCDYLLVAVVERFERAGCHPIIYKKAIIMTGVYMFCAPFS